MNIKLDDVFVNKDKPYLSKKVTYLDVIQQYGNEELIDKQISIVGWDVYNNLEFEKKVCEYKKVESIDELIKLGRSTYPFAINGAMTLESFESYIRRNKMIKLED